MLRVTRRSDNAVRQHVFLPQSVALVRLTLKALRIQHSKDIIKEAKKDRNFLYSIVTGDETWCFEYDPETKRQSAEWKAPDEPKPKKSRMEKSKIKTLLITFYDSKGIIHKEFVPPGKTVNAVCLGMSLSVRPFSDPRFSSCSLRPYALAGELTWIHVRNGRSAPIRGHDP